jgi:cell wall-associated NlpC family hydrolase/uncharacterized protein YgiM (DUF1202 family)
MRKPLLALGLAVSAGLGANPVAGALAASPSSPSHSSSSPNGTYATSSSPSRANAVSGAQIVQTALRYIGYRYTATGNSPSTGFSCIGFVSFVYRSNGIPLPGDLGNALAYAPQVPFSSLQPGDILYFQNTVWAGLSHAAIYLGGGRFVHAEWYNRGVVTSSFNNDPVDGNYWIGKYLGANRPWGGPAGSPVVTSAPASGSATGTLGAVGVTVNSVNRIGGQQGVVTVSSLNVRTSPSKNSSVSRVIPQGASVTIIGKTKGWDKVQLTDGTVGWVVAVGVGTGTAGNSTTSANGANGSIGVQQQVASPTIGNTTQPTRQSVPARVVHRPTTKVRVNGLRVHAGPSLGSATVDTVSTGQKVQILSRGNGWMKVRTPSGAVGWIVSGYTGAVHRPTGTVSKTSPTQQIRSGSTSRSVAGKSRLTAGVRVHASPGVKSPVIGLAGAGTRVQIIGRSGGWVLVRLPSGQTGYVSGAFVRLHP